MKMKKSKIIGHSIILLMWIGLFCLIWYGCEEHGESDRNAMMFCGICFMLMSYLLQWDSNRFWKKHHNNG